LLLGINKWAKFNNPALITSPMTNLAEYESLFNEAEKYVLRAEIIADPLGKLTSLNQAIGTYRQARELAANNPEALAHIDGKVDYLIERKVDAVQQGIKAEFDTVRNYVGPRVIGFRNNNYLLQWDAIEGITDILKQSKIRQYADEDVRNSLKKGGAAAGEIADMLIFLGDIRKIKIEIDDW
jgi:hypothetical protein